MWQLTSQEEVEEYTHKRAGETKLGEHLTLLSSTDNIESEAPRFVILGVEEDIGVRANLGKPGAAQAFGYFMEAFCNVQHNRFLNGMQIGLAGTLTFPELMEQAALLSSTNKDDVAQLRALTAKVDSAVAAAVQRLVKAGKIPIVIGGGHNNAYGNITGCAEALGEGLAVLNIDPHADFRALEGRHSGNGFHYAFAEKRLARYAVFGLHESYNSQSILEAFRQKENLSYLSYDAMLGADGREQERHFKNLLHWLGRAPLGLEVDMDSAAHFPVSARTPSGYTVSELRHWVKMATALKAPVYAHFCEAAPGQAAGEAEKAQVGKALAYLVCDFIKAHPAYI